MIFDVLTEKSSLERVHKNYSEINRISMFFVFFLSKLMHFNPFKLRIRFIFSFNLQKEVTIPTLPPDDIDNDWIGPPDKLSNIRQIRICVPPNETAIEREYREKREALQKWHHQFWAKHNKSFFQVS